MKSWGQVDYRHALVGVGLTFCSWFGGVVWTRYTVAEDARRELEAHDKALKGLEGLPVEDLKHLPARVERIEAATASYRDAQQKQGESLDAILEWTRRHR